MRSRITAHEEIHLNDYLAASFFRLVAMLINLTQPSPLVHFLNMTFRFA